MLIIADDLTGAADTAGAFATNGHRCEVILDRSMVSVPAEPAVISIDADTRVMHERDAFDVTETIVRDHCGRPLFLKVDSTVRGHVRATVLAALAAMNVTSQVPARAVVCPAFPALGRTVVDGVVMLDGRPVPDGDLRERMADVSVATELVIADARTDADLGELVRTYHDPGGPLATLWVGSAGLARHLAARSLPGTTASTHAGDRAPHLDRHPSQKVVVVVGSQHERASQQLARLRADTRLAQIDPREPAHVEEILPVLRDADGLVLTGGHTAHVVLAALGVSHFSVCGEVEPGIPWGAATRDGKPVSIVTKSGGFGNDVSLRRCVEFLEQR